MTPNDPRLTAYALGELDDAERTEVEAAMTQSPALAAEVEAIRAAAATLEAAFVAEPVLAMTDEQRNAIDPSRRREPADFQSVERKRHDFPSRDREGAGPGKSDEATGRRSDEGKAVVAPTFVRRIWVPIALAASLTLAATAYYVTLPTLSRARELSSNLVRPKNGGEADLSIPPFDPNSLVAVESRDDQAAHSMSPSSRQASQPDFGQGVPQSDPATQTALASLGYVGQPFNGNLGFNSPTQVGEAPQVNSFANARQYHRFGYDPLGGLPATVSDFGTAATTLGRTASPNQNLELYYDFQGVRNISYGYQVPFGPPSGREELHLGRPEASKVFLSFPAVTTTERLSEKDGAQQLRFVQEPVGGLLERIARNDGFAMHKTSRATQAGRDIEEAKIPWHEQLAYPGWEAELQSGDAYAPVFDNPFHLVAHQPLSTFSIDVDTASYSNVRRMLNSGTLPPRDAVRIEEIINYFDYDYPLPTDGRPFSVNVETSDCPWSPTHRLARIGIKGMEFAANQRPAANLVFLIDVSGSMQDANRLPLVQQSLRMLVGELRRDDQVAMVVYAGASGLVLPATKCGNSGTILEAIDRLQAGGSTNGGAGIQLAYETAEANFIEGGVNRVILATDGDFNVGVTNSGELTSLVTEKAKGGVFLTVLGFGMGNLKDATLESLADKGNGNYAYIDSLAEAKKTLVDQIGGTLVTIAKDVKIQVEFNPAQVSSYRLIGYENRLLAARDFNDDTKDAGEIGAGHTVTAFYEIVPAGESVDDGGVDALKYQHRTSDGATEPQSHEDSEPETQATETAEGDSENTETPKRRNAETQALGDAESDESTGESNDLSDELMTVKLRYKAPNDDVSELIEVPVVDSGQTFADSSDDFAFALSAASFGMLLRGYPTGENFDYDFVHELASGSMGDDASGYRAEFVELVNRARAIAVARNGPDGGR